MATLTPIHMTDRQRKNLLRRARRRKTTLVDEVNTAIDFYLDLPPDIERDDFESLVREANASMKRSIARLDKTIAFCKRTMERINELERRQGLL